MNPFDYSVCRILQEKVCKTRITDLNLLAMPLTNGCCNDDVVLNWIQIWWIWRSQL